MGAFRQPSSVSFIFHLSETAYDHLECHSLYAKTTETDDCAKIDRREWSLVQDSGWSWFSFGVATC